ncbi:hypothetical protein C7S17_5269 [Burkholderia thailandensis]|nr:hypothetical protein [Burkholderia thailandensis]
MDSQWQFLRTTGIPYNSFCIFRNSPIPFLEKVPITVVLAFIAPDLREIHCKSITQRL